MIVLFAEPLSHFRHFFCFVLSPWADTRLYRSPPSPSPFPSLDGDHPATETIPEITLKNCQAQRCCRHRNALVSGIDADARLSRKKTLCCECHVQVRACLTALPCHHSHAHKLPLSHAQPVIDNDDFTVLAAAPLYLPLRSKMSFTPSLIMFATSVTTITNVRHVWSAIPVDDTDSGSHKYLSPAPGFQTTKTSRHSSKRGRVERRGLMASALGPVGVLCRLLTTVYFSLSSFLYITVILFIVWLACFVKWSQL